jgi:predicted N-formylglutamate amidohydrolase
MPLLTPRDPSPVTVIHADSASPFVIICDHAGRRVPEGLGDLGLAAAEFDRHIAWDIGAAGLSRLMGEALGACVITQTYCRLVIDCNRWPGAADSIPDHVDGASIVGNRDLSAEQIAARLAEIHTPYHDAISAVLDDRASRGVPTALILVHSFTPSLSASGLSASGLSAPGLSASGLGKERPWHVGVLHAHDSPLSDTMLGLLNAEPGYVVGDNQPYAMDGTDYTAPYHARPRGLDYCELEIRQDLIAQPAGQQAFATLLSRLLTASLG